MGGGEREGRFEGEGEGGEVELYRQDNEGKEKEEK